MHAQRKTGSAKSGGGSRASHESHVNVTVSRASLHILLVRIRGSRTTIKGELSQRIKMAGTVSMAETDGMGAEANAEVEATEAAVLGGCTLIV